MLSVTALHAALEGTWPPAARHVCGPFTLRDGQGGGKRVSAATLDGTADGAQIAAAEAAMRARGQTPLFMLLDQPELDAALAVRGYGIVDPTLFYAAPIADLAAVPRPVSLLSCWPPLAIQRQLWADAGIGPARLAVMARAGAPRNAFIARIQNRAAGVGFAAVHDGIAMLHALEVVPDFRRRGVARHMMRGIADWAQGQGAEWVALAVTERNIAARALYSSLNMAEAGRYHYRQHAKAQP
ncbi:MAG: GNAT family N-acetyltransferase [Pararhodobacter sp.]|nr:GNAT family N-acetyltransferase [Pararhodobacter sp.]